MMGVKLGSLWFQGQPFATAVFPGSWMAFEGVCKLEGWQRLHVVAPGRCSIAYRLGSGVSGSLALLRPRDCRLFNVLEAYSLSSL